MISAHILVKDESTFVWYSVMSVIRHVDKVLLFDMGSADGTKEIINEILTIPEFKNKVIFKELPDDKEFDERKIRQEMLEMSDTDWIILVDGDEIWWDGSIKKVISTINEKRKDIDSIVVPTVNLVGDIFHYQEEKAGRYHLAGKVGHYNLRAFRRNIASLHYVKPHGTTGLADENGTMIQDRGNDKVILVDAPYMHATHLQRSGLAGKDKEVYKRAFKRKHELGIPFTNDFYYPEVFFRLRPTDVPSVWKNMNFKFKFRAFFETPLRKINRRYLPQKVGY